MQYILNIKCKIWCLGQTTGTFQFWYEIQESFQCTIAVIYSIKFDETIHENCASIDLTTLMTIQTWDSQYVGILNLALSCQTHGPRFSLSYKTLTGLILVFKVHPHTLIK